MLKRERFELVTVMVWGLFAMSCGAFFYCCATARAPIGPEPSPARMPTGLPSPGAAR